MPTWRGSQSPPENKCEPATVRRFLGFPGTVALKQEWLVPLGDTWQCLEQLWSPHLGAAVPLGPSVCGPGGLLPILQGPGWSPHQNDPAPKVVRLTNATES